MVVAGVSALQFNHSALHQSKLCENFEFKFCQSTRWHIFNYAYAHTLYDAKI